MDRYGHCHYCKRRYEKNPRVKNQRYCSKPDCQRARRRRWQRHKMATDPDYKMNQQDCMRRWRDRHPGYWKRYRESHPSYTSHNMVMQRFRNFERSGRPMIANMGAINDKKAMIPGVYYLLRKCALIAKMDSFFQKVVIFPVGCLQPALIAK